MKEFFRAALFSVRFLTILPVPAHDNETKPEPQKVLACFPLAGWLVGGLLLLSAQLIAAAGGCSTMTAAVLIVAVETCITGAFHLDALADSFDGLSSFHTTGEQKLSIMKDSRIGVMGATALVLVLLLRAVFISDLFSRHMLFALCLYPAIGRWCAVALYATSSYVRSEGTGLFFAQGTSKKTLFIAGTWLLPCFLYGPFFAGLLPALLLLWGYRRWVIRSIGGITGDITGCGIVLAETGFLLGLVLFAGP